MAIEITDLTALDSVQTAQSLAQTTEMVQEAQPAIDVKRGVLHDLLLYMHALLDSQLRTGLLDRYLSANSLVLIEADPTLADSGVVDGVLSNFLLTRAPGSDAIGQVTIVLSQSISVTIASGTVFTANGNTYTADAAYTAKASQAQINNTTDRLLTALDDGTWAFTIDVTATTIGSASLVTAGTLVVPAVTPTAYLTSYATGDFTDGLDAQTNAQLITLLQQGIAAKAPSNPVNMQAMLLANPEFSAVVGSSIVGAGSPEMIRDQHTILPVSLGGKADWYVRTTLAPTAVALTKTATLISIGPTGGVWQFGVGKDDAPGFYEITSILLPTASNTTGTFQITADMRGLDLTGSGFIPDIETITEGAYSRFQTSVVQFLDNVTSYTALSPGATATYAVTVNAMSLIGDIQDYVSSPGVRSYGADVLIKAPVPCFVHLYFKIAKTAAQAAPDTNMIATAVANAVNSLGFTGRLYAAMLQDVIGGYLSGGTSVRSIDMFGKIRNCDGSISYVRSNDVLVIDHVPTQPMTSHRTVQFFCDPTQIEIEVVSEIPSN